MVRATSRGSCATAADSGGGGALIHGVQEEAEPRTDREDPSPILKYPHLPPPPPPHPPPPPPSSLTALRAGPSVSQGGSGEEGCPGRSGRKAVTSGSEQAEARRSGGRHPGSTGGGLFQSRWGSAERA